MVKIALLASAMLVAASAAAIGSADAAPATAPAIEQACHLDRAPDAACLRALDTDGDGKVSATELASLAVPAAEPTPLAPLADAGLAFQDDAADPGPVLPASLDHARPQPLVPALFALGGLVILLRRRPA